MTEPTRSDAESREVIEHQLDCNLLVEAAAGTGKTHSIVSRMVSLIASGTCEIDQLAAVTFTRKAAAELRERFHARIHRESTATERSQDEIRRLRGAANRIDQSFVGTFHAFCSTLLRERPIECNVDPGFREIEEQEDAQLREEAWQTFIADLYSKQDARLDRIAELGLQASDLKSCYRKFAEFPDVEEWPHTRPAEIGLENLKAQTRQYIGRMEGLIPLFPDDRGTDKLMERYEQIVGKAEHIDWTRRGEFFELLEMFNSSRKATQKWWHDKGVAKDESNRFADFRDTVKTALDWWYGYRYEFVIELLQDACRIYDEMRAASGGLDFQDLLIKAASALWEQPKLRNYFQGRYTHLLVDEFQDTDPIQAEMLAFLTSDNHEETNWQQCRPRPGSLFLVGDPKQSIYRFRRADIVTYKQVKEMLVRSNGQVVKLSKSFRSTLELREWSNEVFRQFFGKVETQYSPASVDMEAGRDNATDGQMCGVVRLPIPDMRRDDATQFEADTIAKYVRWAIDTKQTISRTAQELRSGKTNHAEAGDFLIITWNKAVLGTYGEALDRYGIPNEVTGSRAFSNLLELKAVLDCLRAIDDSRNPIPYVAVLRGDLFGFSDVDLYELVKTGGRLSYTAKVPDLLNEELTARITDVNERLIRYLRWIRNLPFAAALLKIIDDLGLLAKAASHGEGNSIAGGFLKAVEWLRGQSWNFDSATDMITYLESLTESAEAEGCTALPENPSVVRVMNLHKVKGLEAPVVFLANTHGASRPRTPSFHVDRSRAVPQGYLSISKEIGTGYRKRTLDIARPSDWAQAMQEETRFKEAEIQRLLYVAATRAACQLVISTATKEYTSHWTPFHKYLVEAPELQVPSVDTPRAITSPTAEFFSKDEAEVRIATLWENARAASYNVVAAKEIALKGISRPIWHASGNYGHKWGTAIHELLDIHLKRPAAALEHHARRLTEELELGSDRVDELISTVRVVAESDIWRRAGRAIKKYAEVPFEIANHNDALPTLTKGVIDLVFRDEDGWVIVDYKTDDIEITDLADATTYYDKQLAAYAIFWEDIVQETVIERGIYFTKLLHYEAVALK